MQNFLEDKRDLKRAMKAYNGFELVGTRPMVNHVWPGRKTRPRRMATGFGKVAIEVSPGSTVPMRTDGRRALMNGSCSRRGGPSSPM